MCPCFVENDVIIGNNVTVKSGVQLWDGLRVKDNVFIGANVSFINDLIPRSKVYPSEFLMTTLEEHCSIGANSTIMGGLIIGEYALVGAGSVVTKMFRHMRFGLVILHVKKGISLKMVLPWT